ncbi:MAG: hypothetical protein LKCHEGNO_03600 [Burkholderiaceae bacterium]|nr:hypothetical protein [Burkholderiaceae bacterium]
MNQTPLSVLLKLAAYRDQRQHVFPSPGALEWFVRRHRAGLVNAGALVMLTGQWHAHADKFDAYVLQAGQEAAQRHNAISEAAA